MPKLQCAIDVPGRKEALRLAEEVVLGGADILEVGTPLIALYGVRIVNDFHDNFPDMPLYADLKLIDFPESQMPYFFEAGASVLSVLLVSNGEVLRSAIAIAKTFGRSVALSSMGCPQEVVTQRAVEAIELGGQEIIAHGSGPQEQAFLEMREKARLLNTIPGDLHFDLILAGGIDDHNLETIMGTEGVSTIIVGRSVSTASDPRGLVCTLKDRISRWNPQEKNP